MPELAADLVRRRVAVIAVPASIRGGTGGQNRDLKHSDCLCNRRRPDRIGPRRQPQSAGRQRHGSHRPKRGPHKRLGLLRELAPQATRFVALVSPNAVNTDAIVKEVHGAFQSWGRPLKSFTPAPAIAISRRLSQISRKGPARHCWSLSTSFFSIVAHNSSRWQRATRYQPSISARICRYRWADQLRNERRQPIRAHRHLHGPRPQRRETGRPAGPATYKTRHGHQSLDRQGALDRRTAHAACARRRGDRMM